MSVKGFLINGTAEKYDYKALDNLPTGTGLSDEAKQALLACFENVAWINANGQTFYDSLEAALYPSGTYSVTNALTNCTTSNSAVVASASKPYSAIITPYSGYTLTGADVSITMGGEDATGYYNNGSISIPNVTGDLVITVTATSAVTGISAVFTQGQNVIYTTDSLDDLRQYLVVTATYADSSTATVSDYTLSGTLTEGASIITASYGGRTGTFTVTVTAWKYTYNLTDGLVKTDTGVTPSNAFSTVHTSGEIVLTQGDSAKRRGFPTTIETARCMKTTASTNPYPADLSDTNYYPVQIPADAVGVTVTITPSSQFVAVRTYTYSSTNLYTPVASSGWQQGSSTMSFVAGSVQYLSVVSKYNSAGTTYPTEPTSLAITFSTT